MHNSLKQAAANAPASSCVEIIAPLIILQAEDVDAWEIKFADKHDCHNKGIVPWQSHSHYLAFQIYIYCAGC